MRAGYKRKKQQKIKLKNLSTYAHAGFLLLWVAASFAPAYTSLGTNESAYGFICFMWGVFTPLFDPFLFIVWSSNFTALAAISYLHRKRYDVSVTVASLAVFCSLGALFIKEIPFNESGSTQVVAANIGVYLWVAAIFVPLVGSLVALKIGHK